MFWEVRHETELNVSQTSKNTIQSSVINGENQDYYLYIKIIIHLFIHLCI